MMYKGLTACGAVLCLTACAASTSSSDAPMGDPAGLAVASPNQIYQTFNSQAEATSQLAAIHVDFRNDEVEVEISTGTLRHDTTAIEAIIAGQPFTDPDGLDANDVYSDGVVLVRTSGAGSDDFSNGYDQVDIASGGQIGFGQVGILTNVLDVPTTGTATFTGPAVASYSVPGLGVASDTAVSSTIEADFANGTVDVTLEDIFLPIDIDTITATDMVITGNSFNGGTVTTFSDGTPTTPLGASPSTSAAGAFFGFDPEANGPGEVGGAIVIDGGDNYIDAHFRGE